MRRKPELLKLCLLLREIPGGGWSLKSLAHEGGFWQHRQAHAQARSGQDV